MTGFVQVPVHRLEADTLTALLEEFASRDGTDYGERETPLEERVAQLRRLLLAGELQLLLHPSTETWDLVPTEQVADLEDPDSSEPS